MTNRKLQVAIMAALTMAAIPTPESVIVTDTNITIAWVGNHDGLAAAAANVMHTEGLNYDDPTIGTTDVIISADNEYYSAVFNRLDQEGFLDAGGILPDGTSRPATEPSV